MKIKEDVVNVEDDDDYGDDYDDDYDDDDNIQRSQSESPDSQIHENCRASSKSVVSVGLLFHFKYLNTSNYYFNLYLIFLYHFLSNWVLVYCFCWSIV